MTAEGLGLIAGVLLSLIFAYVPGLDVWFAALDGTKKRLIMLAALFVAALGVVGLGCIGWDGITVTCDEAGIRAMLQAFVLAVIANQSTFLVSPVTKRARLAKAGRVG